MFKTEAGRTVRSERRAREPGAVASCVGDIAICRLQTAHEVRTLGREMM
jgi:hypothetical protein